MQYSKLCRCCDLEDFKRIGSEREDRIAIFGNESIKINDRRDAFRYSIRNSRDHQPNCRMSAENNISKIFEFHEAHCVLNMSVDK